MLHGILNYSRESPRTDPFLFLIDRNDASIGKTERSRTAADRKRKASAYYPIVCFWKFIHLDIIRAIRSVVIDIPFPVRIGNKKTVAFESARRIADKPDAETA